MLPPLCVTFLFVRIVLCFSFLSLPQVCLWLPLSAPTSQMSLPALEYHRHQRLYLPPYGAPVTPTSFTSRQQCRNYYDRIKVHVQLHHNGTWKHCERLLRQFIYTIHPKYFTDLIQSFSNGHDNSWCEGCFQCATDEFWYRFDRVSRKVSHRYPSVHENLNPMNTIEKVRKALRSLDDVERPVEFFKQNMSKLQNALRHWPSIDTLTRCVGMLTDSLPGLDIMLLNKLGDSRIFIDHDGKISIPYSACTPDVMRRVAEVVISNAEKFKDDRLQEIYGPSTSPDTISVQLSRVEDHELSDVTGGVRNVSLSNTLVPDDQSSLIDIKAFDEQKTGRPTCLFCGSSNGHAHEDCPLLESLGESGVLSLGVDGSICDYNGKTLLFETVPWCSSQSLIDCLIHRPSIKTQLEPVNVYETHHLITRTKYTTLNE